MRGRRAAAAIAWIVAFVLLCSAIGLLLGENDIDATDAALILLATATFGFAIRRWWALGIPAAVFLPGLLVAYLRDPTCSKCGEDDSWAVIFVLTMLIGIAPLTLAMLVGVALGKAHRRRQDHTAT
jgi:hypothetical protein